MLEVTFHEEERLLIARYEGEGRPQDVIPHFPAMVEECRSRKRDLLIIDFSAIKHPAITTHDMFEIGASARVFADTVKKTASLVRPDQRDREEFGVVVARNRGLTVQEFTSLDEARAWLLL